MPSTRTHIYCPETDTWKIELTKGYYAVVDDADYSAVSELMWHAHMTPGGVYGRSDKQSNYARRKVYLHRFLVTPPEGYMVDHADGDTLNNRRSNLRVVTKSRNMMNKGKIGRKGGASSRFKGVSKTKQGKWHAYINFDSKRRTLGYFHDETEAAKAYNAAALMYHGEFAFLNQINEQGQ